MTAASTPLVGSQNTASTPLVGSQRSASTPLLDIDRYCECFFPVRLGSTDFHIHAPSVRVVRQLLRLGDARQGDDAFLDEQLRLAGVILSDNREGMVIGQEALESLTPGAIQAVLTAALKAAVQAVQDPD